MPQLHCVVPGRTLDSLSYRKSQTCSLLGEFSKLSNHKLFSIEQYYRGDQTQLYMSTPNYFFSLRASPTLFSFLCPPACVSPPAETFKRFSGVLLFLNTSPAPPPPPFPAVLHFPSQFFGAPLCSSFSHGNGARMKRGRRMRGEGQTGSHSRKMKQMKQNVLNCWLKRLPGNELGAKLPLNVYELPLNQMIGEKHP